MGFEVCDRYFFVSFVHTLHVVRRFNGAARVIINCSHEDVDWKDRGHDVQRFFLNVRFRGAIKHDGEAFGWKRRTRWAPPLSFCFLGGSTYVEFFF